MNCTKCSTPLTEENWPPSLRKSKDYRCSACRSQMHAEWRASNKHHLREYNRQRYLHQDTRIRFLLDRAKHRAKTKNLPCTITVGDIIIPDRCPVLGIEITLDGARDTSPSIDRINPKLGYVPGNIVVMSTRANQLKSDASIEELELLLQWYRRILVND